MFSHTYTSVGVTLICDSDKYKTLTPRIGWQPLASGLWLRYITEYLHFNNIQHSETSTRTNPVFLENKWIHFFEAV